MSSITSQQAKLDLELVPKEKRLEIGKSNGRLNLGKTQREPTFQFVLDALALTPCYSAFLTTADVPKICPRVHGQDFDKLPTDEVIVSFFKELGHTRERKSITDVVVDQMHQPWRTFATIINRSLSGKTIGLDKLLTPPKKARKFKKPASPKLTTVPASPNGPIRKSKRVERPTKKFTNAPTAGVVIRDTPGMSIKKTLKKSKQETHNLQASGSSEEADFESEVPDKSKAKSSDINKGTDVKPGVPDVFKVDSFESNNESWGDSDDDNKSDEMMMMAVKMMMIVAMMHKIEFNDEEYDDLYKDVSVRSKVAEHEEVRKGDVEIPDATRESGSQEKSYEQVIEDTHVTLTTSQKTEGSKQSSSMSSDFASSSRRIKNSSTPLLSVPVTVVSETSTIPATTVPPTIQPFISISQQSTPTPKPTTEPSITLIALPDFSSLILASIRLQIPAIVDDHLSIRIGFATQTALQSYTAEFEKKAQEEKDRYIDLVEKSIKDIIKDEDKSQLSQILPKEVSDFATPMIQSAINESLENVILAKYSSQPKSTFEAATSLTEFELKKILLDKIQKSKSYQASPEHKELYDALTSKDAEPTKGPNTKESKSSSSKGTKSQRADNGYGYLREIEVQRADNELYTFKEGDFLRLRINEINDMLILRVEDLQLGVKSYQKKINITKPETTRPDIKKRDPYTPHTDPQGFIYVDNQWRNRLMCLDELYKFSDGTLTRLRTSLDDITKNIQMEYLLQRRWSSLEKKRV
ncbi:hypothetical protein Tco_1343177 [Tanacetum coccineum]